MSLLGIRFLLLLLVIFAFGTVLARSQQPFYTDDTDVAAQGKFHFEFSNQFDLLHPSSFPNLKQNTASFELAYGLFEDIEVSIEAPLLTIFNTRGFSPRTVAGVGDTNFAVKYNFRQEQENSRLPAITVSFNLELPTGDTSRQLGSGIADYAFNGILQKSLTERTKWRVNGGTIFSGNTLTGAVGIKERGLVFTGGTSLVRQWTPRLNLGAEITGALSRNPDLGGGQLQVQAGGNYALRDNLTLDFGLVAGRFSASPRIGAQLGVSVDF